MRRLIGTALAFGLALSVATFAQGPRRDGKWEVSVEMDMPGMKMPPMKNQVCITPEEAKDPMKAMPQGPHGPQGDCKVENYKVDGNKLSFAMSCGGQMPMSGQAEMTYAGDTYTGTMKVTMGPQTMTMNYTGKRLGDCTK